jgi:CBS domain-containing protein
METPISTLLAEKNDTVYCVSPSDTVQDAVLVMNDHHIGSVVVIDEGQLVGIFTERDVLRRVVEGDLDSAKTLVSQVMATEVTTVSPSTRFHEAMDLITTRRHRHLPVMDEGRLVGLVSVRDILQHVSHSYKVEVGQLWNYITGENSHVESDVYEVVA